MAIWQFNLYFIPKQALLYKYGQIPERLFIDREGWENYFKYSDIEKGVEFEDALSINWWLLLNMFTDELFSIMDNSWHLNAWKKTGAGLICFGNADSNNVCVCFNEKTKQVEELSCRIDLRQIDKGFVNKIISIANQFDCLFMDKQGRLFEPNLVDLLNNIKLSNSNRFVLDPEQFLKDMQSGMIEPE